MVCRLMDDTQTGHGGDGKSRGVKGGIGKYAVIGASSVGHQAARLDLASPQVGSYGQGPAPKLCKKVEKDLKKLPGTEPSN